MSYKDLEKNLNYKFKNIKHLELALTHKSFSNANNNERLEFLGDSILNSIISQHLFKRFVDVKEGLLTRMRAYLVKAETLTIKAEELSLGDYIQLSKGTANLSKDRKNSILEDSFEAIIGAIYLDSNWDQVNTIVLDTFDKELKSLSADMNFKDSKTELQELLQSMRLDLPKYVLESIGSEGFNCSVDFKDQTFQSVGISKQRAETRAALKVLEYIKSNNE